MLSHSHNNAITLSQHLYPCFTKILQQSIKPSSLTYFWILFPLYTETSGPVKYSAKKHVGEHIHILKRFKKSGSLRNFFDYSELKIRKFNTIICVVIFQPYMRELQQGSIWNSLANKNKGLKSRNTVPLNITLWNNSFYLADLVKNKFLWQYLLNLIGNTRHFIQVSKI